MVISFERVGIVSTQIWHFCKSSSTLQLYQKLAKSGSVGIKDLFCIDLKWNDHFIFYHFLFASFFSLCS